jgi:uncharacterized paraquat-inducible protein A
MKTTLFQLRSESLKLIRKISTFIKSLLFHVWSGFPKSTKEQINARLSICKECEYYSEKDKQCMVCGCNLSDKKIFMNKLAWADQECPIGKWKKLI